jgi:hypothetical protein
MAISGRLKLKILSIMPSLPAQDNEALLETCGFFSGRMGRQSLVRKLCQVWQLYLWEYLTSTTENL